MKAKLLSLVSILFVFQFAPVYSQSNQVEIIDYYGSGYSVKNAQACLPFRENDSVSFIDDDALYTSSVIKIESCLLKIPKIRQSEVSFVCCTQPGNKWMVYVGLDSAAAPAKPLNKTKDIKLPTELTSKYVKLMDLLIEAIELNKTEEDNSNGHSMIVYEPGHSIQEQFITYANANLELLRNVLRNSKYPEQREVAAYVIAYHDNKNEIVPDLIKAIDDSEDGVRNNAIRAVNIIAEFALTWPELNISIDTKPFIKLMNSISWTDRNKSSLVLLSLTQTRKPEIMRELKSTALKSIIDMAGWRNFGHSLPGYILLGRLVGWSEQVIMSGVNNERKAQVDEMLRALK